MAEYVNQRREGESYEDYKARCRAQTKAERFKFSLAGMTRVWDSFRQGTKIGKFKD